MQVQQKEQSNLLETIENQKKVIQTLQTKLEKKEVAKPQPSPQAQSPFLDQMKTIRNELSEIKKEKENLEREKKTMQAQNRMLKKELEEKNTTIKE